MFAWARCRRSHPSGKGRGARTLTTTLTLTLTTISIDRVVRVERRGAGGRSRPRSLASGWVSWAEWAAIENDHDHGRLPSGLVSWAERRGGRAFEAATFLRARRAQMVRLSWFPSRHQRSARTHSCLSRTNKLPERDPQLRRVQAFEDVAHDIAAAIALGKSRCSGGTERGNVCVSKHYEVYGGTSLRPQPFRLNCLTKHPRFLKTPIGRWYCWLS